MGKTFDKAKKI